MNSVPKTTTSLSDYENVTVHEGDLVIDGFKTFDIQNCTYIQTGNIIVKDFAEVTIRNAHIIINDHYKSEYTPLVTGQASLTVENSLLEANFMEGEGSNLMAELVWNVEEDAVLNMKNSFSYLRFAANNGKITVDSSTVAQFLVPPSLYYINLSNSVVYVGMFLRLGENHQNWSFGSATDIMLEGLSTNQKIESLDFVWGRKLLKLQNTTVGRWDADITYFFRKNLTIKDSSMGNIMLNFDQSVNISNIRPGYFQNWNIHQNVQGQTPWNLTLLNVTVESWKLITFSDTYIENVTSILDPFNDKTVIVKDSEIVSLDARGSKFLQFTNCIVRGIRLTYMPELEDFCGHGNFSIEFENSTIGGPKIDIAVQFAFIRGEILRFVHFKGEALRPPLTLDDVNFQKGVLVREFPLIMEDDKGNPLPNTPISLRDPNGALVSNMTTDQHGQTSFNLTFTKENYCKNWSLVATTNNINFSEEVGFLVSTPIVFSFKGVKEKVGDAVSRAETMIDWAQNLGRTNNLDQARSLLMNAKDSYFSGELGEALRVAEEIVGLLWIKVDGDPSDWEQITPLVVDPEGDAKGLPGDLKSLYAVADGYDLCLMMEVYDERPVADMFLIGFDTDQAKFDHYEIFCGIGGFQGGFNLIDSTNKQIQYKIEASCDKVLEIRIPLKLIGDPELLGISVRTGYPTIWEEIQETDMLMPQWNLFYTRLFLRADLNEDGSVNIQDITIVAVAYGSETGDTKWNEVADLDKNGMVNIVDISLVAKDYGKTV